MYRHQTSVRSPFTGGTVISDFEARPILRLSRGFMFDIQYKLSSIHEVPESLENSPIKKMKE